MRVLTVALGTARAHGAGSAGRWGPRTGAVVVVEPLHGSPAVLAALDAGWDEIEVAAEAPGQATLPIAACEMPPPAPGQRSRLRSGDLLAAIAAGRVIVGADGDARPLLVAGPTSARPSAATLARWAVGRAGSVTFVPAPATGHGLDDGADPDRDGGELASDALWACGLLLRVLLDELGDEPTQLTEAAGVAVAVASGEEPPASVLGAGMRWRRHVARGGAPSDLPRAAAIDVHAVTGSVSWHDGVPIIRPWVPAPVVPTCTARRRPLR